MDRQEGYYWVKEQSSSVHTGRFIICKWNGAFWEMFGLSGQWYDLDFEHINEVRIKQPGELPD